MVYSFYYAEVGRVVIDDPIATQRALPHQHILGASVYQDEYRAAYVNVKSEYSLVLAWDQLDPLLSLQSSVAVQEVLVSVRTLPWS